MRRWLDGVPVLIRPVLDQTGPRFLSGQLNFKMKSLLPLDFLLALSKCNSIQLDQRMYSFFLIFCLLVVYFVSWRFN